MKKIFALVAFTMLISNMANAARLRQIGMGTSLGGFCTWYASIDLDNLNGPVIYETDCGGNGLVVAGTPTKSPRSLKAEFLASAEFISIKTKNDAIAKKEILALQSNARVGGGGPVKVNTPKGPITAGGTTVAP